MKTKMICRQCGHVFDPNEVVYKYYDTDTGTYDREECPDCGSEDIEETERCVVCGNEHSPDSLEYGVCDDCIKKAISQETAFKYGSDRKVSVELNGYLAWAFDGRIEDILKEHLQYLFDSKNLPSEYCTDDKSDFAWWMVNENDAD